MKNNYEYYLKTIKPIEKKYNRMCTLYRIFKFKTFLVKRNIYNKIIINYYNKLLHNKQALKELEEYFELFDSN